MGNTNITPAMMKIIDSHQKSELSNISDKISPEPTHENASNTDRIIQEAEAGIQAMTQRTQEGLNNPISGVLEDFVTHNTEFKNVLDDITTAVGKSTILGIGGPDGGGHGTFANIDGGTGISSGDKGR